MRLLVLVPSRRELAGLGLPSHAGKPRDAGLVSVAGCGVGVVAAGVTTARLLARIGPDHVLLAGIAGARVPDLGAGDLVEGVAVANEAVGAGEGGGFRGLEALGFGPPDGPADRLALAPLPGPPSDADVRRGVVATVAATSATPAQAAARQALSPDVLVEEMEGHAVALACAGVGVPCSILRAVSNAAGDRRPEAWDVDAALSRLAARLRPLVGAAVP